MRHVGDRMIVSPPLVITPGEIDELVRRARRALDEAYAEVKAQGLLKAAS
jgi:putrescine aminotransferase